MSASVAILMLTSALAAEVPNGTIFQLQKNCEELAAEKFRRETSNDEDRVGYRAHYNARLNKCFYAETYISGTPKGVSTWVYLSDLQENRIYGGFHNSTNIGLFTAQFETRNVIRERNGTNLLDLIWKIDGAVFHPAMNARLFIR